MNYKDPIFISVVGLILSTICFILIFYFTKPTFVTYINNNGQYQLDIGKMLAYSFLFAIVFAIIIILLLTQFQKESFSEAGNNKNFNYQKKEYSSKIISSSFD